MAKKNTGKEAPEQPAVSTTQYASKIEAIKDIIFGEDYAALRAALSELDTRVHDNLAKLDDRLSDVIKDVDATIKNRIDNLEMDLKAEIDRLDDAKTDRHKLGKMLEEIGKSLQA